MEHQKLFDSEFRLMELLWTREPVTAKELSLAAGEEFGWNKNTTYTVIKKLVDKGVVKRTEPGFLCEAIIKRGEVERTERDSLINKLYGGSKRAFFAAFLQDEDLSDDDIEELRRMIARR